MDNNDRLIRIRYALDIKDTDMVKIFKLGGIELTRDEVQKILIKSKKESNPVTGTDQTSQETEENIKCSNIMFDSFLNGLITFKRGSKDQEPEAERTEKSVLAIKESASTNNIMLKKLKIALSLSGEDMIDVFKTGGIIMSKGELSAIFRKEGHRNYRVCGDSFAKNFLKGLAVRYRI